LPSVQLAYQGHVFDDVLCCWLRQTLCLWGPAGCGPRGCCRRPSGALVMRTSVPCLWFLRVLQAAFRRISNEVFAHLLALDLNWHIHRKTGQIMRILDRGTSSIQVRGDPGAPSSTSSQVVSGLWALLAFLLMLNHGSCGSLTPSCGGCRCSGAQLPFALLEPHGTDASQSLYGLQ